MSRMVNSRKQFHMKPVERIELSKRCVGLRAAAAIISALIAAAALAFAFFSLVNRGSGWRVIDAGTTDKKNNCSEFLLQYDIGSGSMDSTSEYKKLSALFAQLNAEAFAVFSSDEEVDGCNNIFYINSHPNEIISVEPALYRALCLFESCSRLPLLFAAPVYEQYKVLYSCADDYQAAECDPYLSSQVKAYVEKAALFINDSKMISLELMGENRLRLNVSDEYKAFAAEESIGGYIDLFWLKNAFIADYTAEALIAEGFTHGILSSYDGFVRHLGEVSFPIYFDIYGKAGASVYSAAHAEQPDGVNIVHFRNYKKSPFDAFGYYEYDSGDCRTPYIDPASGLCRGPVSDFYVFSQKTCAETALKASEAYIAEELDSGILSSLSLEGINTVYCSNNTVYYTDAAMNFTDLYSSDSLSYKTQLIV